MAFDEGEILAEFDRSYRDRAERLVLEKGEYRGRPTYTLRVQWRAEDNSWRWSPAKPSQSGRCWQALNLKARELRQLGLALVAEADELEQQQPQEPERGARRPSPREQRELHGADGWPAPVRRDDDQPF